MNHADYHAIPHRRFNPLLDEWVLVSPHRTERPWSGEVAQADISVTPSFSPECYLCPGNIRANGEKTPDYTSTYVFTNDFSALLPDTHSFNGNSNGILRAEPEKGICRVICYSPRHDLSIQRMESQTVVKIIETWQSEFESLGSRESIDYVQIFENRGQMMGCSNPHPHGQVWANQTIPTLPARETLTQEQFFQDSGTCLLCTYLEKELEERTRILFKNTSFAALVPFWAVWPFEAMIIPRNHHSSLMSLTEKEKHDLSSIIIELGVRYDNLFLTSFPYSMGIHQQPTDCRDYSSWHFHIHFFPPLLRSKSVKKHMVGYELLAMPQRDITPESAAQRLRHLPKKHYLADEEE